MLGLTSWRWATLRPALSRRATCIYVLIYLCMMASSPVTPALAAVEAFALKGFKVYALDTFRNPIPSYNRLDFYKISLVTGHIAVQGTDRNRELNGTHLLFANPHISYSTLLLSARVSGYACLFTEEFAKMNGWLGSLQHSPLFQRGGLPGWQLVGEQARYCTGIFEKMLDTQNLNYLFKGELVCSYLQLLLHEGLRMQRQENLSRPATAGTGALLLS